MSRFISPALAGVEPYVPGKQSRQCRVKLNTNECPYPPSPMVIKAVAESAGKLNLYPDPECRELLSALSDRFDLPAGCFFPGNGSDEILAFVFQGLCSDGVAYPDISYGFYPVFSGLYGLNALEIPLDDDFRIAVDQYYSTHRTIIVANPNAPSGIALSMAEIVQILEHNRDNLVVIDEAYVDFGAESAVQLIKDYDNLLIIQTFSKSRALAGGRFGFAAGHQDIIQDLNRIKYSFNPYNVNTMTQSGALAALKDEEYFQNCCQLISQTRQKYTEIFADLGFVATDSAANFIFVTHSRISAEKLYKHLYNDGIYIRWFDRPRIKDYLRISVGTPGQMDELIASIKALI